MPHIYAEGRPDHFETVGRVDEWADGQIKEVKVHKKPMTVARIGDKFFAVNSICPHMGGPLSCGKMENGKIHCPWHGWAFDVETGHSPNGHHLDCYEIKVENGEVKIGWVKKI
ncbi:MAG: Rieske 2Fe-2S domain-containing protein [Candidatus Uhrbacteria bacterium]|nr:Rieske 2Fe-2S domain-containing protein [Candidatus Uhrbacteria bacterium]